MDDAGAVVDSGRVDTSVDGEVEAQCGVIDLELSVEAVAVPLSFSIVTNRFSMALTPDDRTVFAYIAMNGGVQLLAYLEESSDGSWIDETIIGGSGLSDPSLLFTNEGVPFLLHSTSTPSRQTQLQWRDEDVWRYEAIATANSTFNRLFKDPGGNIHGLFNANGTFQLVSPSGDGGWATTWLNTSFPDPVWGFTGGLGASARFDGDGVLHAAHVSGAGDLIYTQLNAEELTSVVVTSDVSPTTSVEFDSTGKLFISFINMETNALQIAERTESSFALHTIGSGGGSWAQLYIDEADVFHVFQLSSENELRYGSGSNLESLEWRALARSVTRADYATTSDRTMRLGYRYGDVMCVADL